MRWRINPVLFFEVFEESVNERHTLLGGVVTVNVFELGKNASVQKVGERARRTMVVDGSNLDE